MIYTVTLNPAIDVIVRLEKLQKGQVNRVREEYLFPGGKGVNVSLVLNRLGTETIATGFLAGATGKAYQALLEAEGVASRFEFLEKGFTRVNMKVSAEEETEINGMGPIVDSEAMERLHNILEQAAEGDYMVLSGNVPGTASGAYAAILQRLSRRKVQVVVDTTGAELESSLPYRPFLIKPNILELRELLGREIRNREELTESVVALRQKGARNVLVSMGSAGACLFTETGERWIAEGVKGTAGNTVGAGDSMVAGFLAGWVKHHSYKEALRLGAAAGTATAFAFGIAGTEEISRCLEKIIVREI